MDYFQKHKSAFLSGLSSQDRLLGFISVNQKVCGNYTTFTYKVKMKKKCSDDKIYSDNQKLLDILPRACTIVVENKQIIGALEGSRKFSGKTPLDEDNETTEQLNIFDPEKVKSWDEQKKLEVISTEKLNGKNTVLSFIRNLKGEILILGMTILYSKIKSW